MFLLNISALKFRNFWVPFLAHFFLACGLVFAQQPSINLIVNGGPVVVQGETITATLTVDSTVPVLKAILFTDLGRVTKRVNGNSTDYDITVDLDHPLGPWSISAVAVLIDGTKLESEVRELTIEPDEIFQSINLSIISPRLDFIGDRSQIDVDGVTTAGKEISLNSSSRISLRSLNPEIVKLTEGDLSLTAYGVGATEIEVSYTDERDGMTLIANAPVTLGTHPKGELSGSGPITISDFNIILSAMDRRGGSYTVRVPNDGRDLNHDGFINEQDLQELLPLCSRPNCHYGPLFPGDPTPTPLFPPTNTFTPTPTVTPTRVPPKPRCIKKGQKDCIPVNADVAAESLSY